MTTRKIIVSLDVKADPPVVLSDRDEHAHDLDIIEWCKKDKNDTFSFTSLDPNGNGTAFSPPSISECGTKFTCKFQPPGGKPSDTPFEYTLTVTKGKETYTTTADLGPLEGGRPVIRN